MKEKNIKKEDKQYAFSTYFIINNGRLISTDNFNFHNNLKNCFYVKKLGTNTNSEFYLDTKIDNEWITQNWLIDVQSFIDFIVQNKHTFICIRGFSYSDIEQILKIINQSKGINIKLIKFGDKVIAAQYERHLLMKQKRIEQLKEALENSHEIENAEQYMKFSNSIFGQNRHKSRQKIMQLRNI